MGAERRLLYNTMSGFAPATSRPYSPQPCRKQIFIRRALYSFDLVSSRALNPGMMGFIRISLLCMVDLQPSREIFRRCVYKGYIRWGWCGAVAGICVRAHGAQCSRRGLGACSHRKIDHRRVLRRPSDTTITTQNL